MIIRKSIINFCFLIKNVSRETFLIKNVDVETDNQIFICFNIIK